MKRCSKCGSEKYESEFGKNKSKPDGLQSYCNPCRHDYDKRWRDEVNPESARLSQETYHLTERYVETRRNHYIDNRDSIRKYGKDHYQSNKDRYRSKNKAWALAHPEETKSYYKKYRDKPETKELKRNWARLDYWKNPEKHRSSVNRWLAAHKEYRRINQQRRMARLAQVENNYSVDDWYKTLEKFGDTCVYCGKTKDLCMDHFIPLVMLGPNTSKNIVPSCRSCNSKKKGSDPKIWVVDNFGIEVYKWIKDCLKHA